MVRRRAQLVPGRQSYPFDRPATHAPDQIALRADDPMALVEREHLWRRSNQISNRDAASVGEQNQRVAGDALAKVGQDRALLATALLDRTTQLRQRDHGDVQLAGKAL